MDTKAQDNLIERSPVIVIMGHIDHGKSTLLDYIRKSNIVAGEAGGITQHIAAYEIEHKDDKGEIKHITFLDTPGHQAFTSMRERGARVADIAILVVSAEEGTKAQTLEALEAIKKGNIPYVIAINKIDRPNADVERTKQNLAEHGLYVEGYGGDIPWVAISAKTGEGVPELLDMMLLVAELAELRGDPSKSATGMVVESSRDARQGVSATLIITDGTIKKGMVVVAEKSFAPVRKIDNFAGKEVSEATFSSPVRISGFDTIPAAGAPFKTFATKKEAERFIAEFKEDKHSAATEPLRGAAVGTQGVAVIPVVVKADMLGTLEAAIGEIMKLQHERVVINVVGSGVGPISESDVKLASGGDMPAIIAGFNVKIEQAAKDAAERYGVIMGTFNIIYKLSEWLVEEFAKRIPKVTAEEVVGKAKIIRLFSRTRDKQVVGGKVLEGKIISNSKVRVLRRDFEIGHGEIIELQQAKSRTKEVEVGKEFGAMIECKYEIAPGDIIEAVILVEK